MFDNIGLKIKLLSKVICWIGIIISVILAIIMFAAADNAHYSVEDTFTTIGFICLFVGPLSSWIGSFLLYGFGELIDSSMKNARYSEENAMYSKTIYNLLNKSNKVAKRLNISEEPVHSNENEVERIFKEVKLEDIEEGIVCICPYCGHRQKVVGSLDEKRCTHCEKCERLFNI